MADIIARGLAATALDEAEGKSYNVFGYFYSGQFYKDSAHTQLITPDEKATYYDVVTDVSYYYYNGSYHVLSTAAGSLYSTTITGDGTTSNFTITHGLNTLAGVVIVSDSQGNDIAVDVKREGVNQYIIGFAEAPAASVTYDVKVVSPKGPKGDYGESFKPMKSAWCGSNLTTAQAAAAILNDSDTRAGNAFLGGVYWSDLSSLGLMNAEVRAYVITEDIIEFNMTSSDTSPYAWFFNSAAGVWRSYVPVVNNTTSTSTTEALSANMGKNLQDQVNNLKNIGRFLSIWDASTGAPSTEPIESPYSYRVGDYYRVGVAGTKNPANNSTYTIGGTNWIEGGSLGVGDVVYVSNLSGTTSTWVKQAASGGGTVQDVQVNGTSIVASGTGIANIPIGFGVPGVLKADGFYQLQIDGGSAVNAKSISYNTYTGGSDNMFVSKGTLENVLDSESVRFDKATSLTDNQKAQGRTNIGAATSEIVADWDNLRTL